MKKSLLFVYIPTHFKEIIRVARVLKNSDGYDPVVYFQAQYAGVENDIEQCNNEGIPVLIEWLVPSVKKAKKKLRLIDFFFQPAFRIVLFVGMKSTNVFRRFSAFCVKYSPVFLKKRLVKQLEKQVTARFSIILYQYACKFRLVNLPYLSKIAMKTMQRIPYIIHTYDIKLMVFPEHNLFYFTQLTAYLGKLSNIPSIIVPFTIANTLEWSEAFYNEPARSVSNGLNKLFSFIFPHWVHHYKNKALILPLELILIHEMLGITPNNPWLLNSGNIDFLAVESDAMKAYYVAAGIDAAYLKSTGALYNDELFQQRQLFKRDDNQKPMLLCALPPNQLLGREQLVEFKNYEAIIRYIISEMTRYADEYRLVISLHPRITKESVAFLRDYPVTISTDNLTQLIPQSHLYISTCSATIRMAISCGIPVVNYDMYQYHYDDYVDAEGVITIHDKAAFSQTLQSLATDNTHYSVIKNKQVKQSAQWGELNGKAGENLLAEIDGLF